MSAKRANGLPATPRAAKWTSEHDQVMFRLFKQEHMLGNCNGGQFINNAWARIVPAFNQQTGLTLTKDKMKNRLKVLMRGFRLYNELVNTKGWHWDAVKHLPMPSELSDWDKMIARKPCCAKCRDRPFPAYADIKLLYGKSTITVKQESDMNGEKDISFSASNDDENTQTQTTAQNDKLLSPTPLRYADPLPHETQPIPQAAVSPVGDVQPMKHHSGTRPLSSDKEINSCSSGSIKKRKIETNSKALDELIELGKQILEIAKVLLNREAAAKSNVYSIGECISKLETIDGITPAVFLAACEAFKDEGDRTIFMHLKEPVVRLWVQMQALKQPPYPQMLNQCPSNNSMQKQPPKQ